MYVTDGWGSVYKYDATKNGELVWKMNPDTDHDFPGAITCCGINNRGVGLWNDKVVSHTLDGRLIITNKTYDNKHEKKITISFRTHGHPSIVSPVVTE